MPLPPYPWFLPVISASFTTTLRHLGPCHGDSRPVFHAALNLVIGFAAFTAQLALEQQRRQYQRFSAALLLLAFIAWRCGSDVAGRTRTLAVWVSGSMVRWVLVCCSPPGFTRHQPRVVFCL